jgi:hypothetical protein
MRSDERLNPMCEKAKLNIILVKMPTGEYEAWSDLKKTCEAHGWAYYTIARKTLPTVTKDGYTIHRVFTS